MSAGRESITEPPTPTKTGEFFTYWQLNGSNIIFPYTPSANVELTAQFQAVRESMEISSAETTLYTEAEVDAKKTSNGTAICGYATYSSMYGPVSRHIFLISLENANTEFNKSTASGSIVYGDKTYYYHKSNPSISNTTNFNDAFYSAGAWVNDSSVTVIVTKILDHYFYKD